MDNTLGRGKHSHLAIGCKRRFLRQFRLIYKEALAIYHVRMKGDNAYQILADWRKSARISGLTEQQIDATIKEATSGDYEHLCKVIENA